MRALDRCSARISLLLLPLLAVALFFGPACARRTAPAPGDATAGTASGTPGSGEKTPSPPPPRPSPYAGAGLAEPYINERGEIELVFADARGVVKVGADHGRVTCASLSGDRLKLAYSVIPMHGGSVEERIYLLDASRQPWEERELANIYDSPVCRLSFSPCGEYLAVDVGTSAVRTLTVLRVVDGARVGSAGVLNAVWAPAPPARLAVGLVTVRPLIPVTELERTVDAAVVEFPSGRLTYLKRSDANEFWSPLEWRADGALKLLHMRMLPSLNEVTEAYVPNRPVAHDSLPTGSGPLPAGVAARPEVNFAGELLLTGPDGAVLRQLTKRGEGRVVDFALAGDGRMLAYVFQRPGEDHTRLFKVALPALTTDEVDIGDFRPDAIGYEPTRLMAAPGARPLVMAELAYGLARIYDLEREEVVADVRGWPAMWLPQGLGRESPTVLMGELPADSLVRPLGEGLSVTLFDVESGARTVIKAGDDQDSYWPIGVADDGTLTVVHQTRNADMELIRMPLPR